MLRSIDVIKKPRTFSKRTFLNKLLTVFVSLWATLSGQLATAAENSTTAYICIIIDDIGNNLRLGKRAIALPGALTYAILPHRPFGKILAQQAHQLQKEIMLHVPMSNIHNKPMGPGSLTEHMDKQEFVTVLRQNIESIPYIEGINNHMGSALTQERQHMEWLMEELEHQSLYFVDSRTSNQSIAWKIARQKRIPNLRRQIFLDHTISQAAIAQQFKKLIHIALNTGSAVAIGHPHLETITFLENAIPKLAQQGIQLVFVSDMLALSQNIDERILLAYNSKMSNKKTQATELLITKR